ncbi:MAG: hypothetical protein AAFV85_26740 [Cyanobacteria bacterium J06634_6]
MMTTIEAFNAGLACAKLQSDIQAIQASIDQREAKRLATTAPTFATKAPAKATPAKAVTPKPQTTDEALLEAFQNI